MVEIIWKEFKMKITDGGDIWEGFKKYERNRMLKTNGVGGI